MTLVKHLFNGSASPAPCIPFHSPQRPKSLENSSHELLGFRVAETHPRVEGQRIEGSGEDRNGRVFIHMGFPDPSTHRIERQRGISDDYTTNSEPELRAFQTSSVREVPDIRQAEEAKQPQGRVMINTDGEEVVGHLLWLMHSIFINVVIYLCLSCSKKIFVQHSKKTVDEEHKLQRSINYNGSGRKMAEWRRNEHSLGPAPNPPGLTGSYRFNSAFSAQRKVKSIVLKKIKISCKIIKQFLKVKIRPNFLSTQERTISSEFEIVF